MRGRRALAGLALAFVAVLVGAGPAASAEEPLHLTLNYTGRLYVKVLEVSVDQVLDARGFTASAQIKTSGLLALFKRINLKAEAQGRIENAVVLPRTFAYLNTDGHKNRHVTTAWSAMDVTTQSQPQFPTLGDPPATREQKLEAADPLTMLARITLLPAADKPCQGVGQFFDGKQRYDVEYNFKSATTPDARERQLGMTSTVRCTLVYREVAGFKRKPANQRGQGLRRDVTLGLGRMGAGGPWVVSSLSADTILGAAVVELVNARVTGQKPG